MNLCSGVEAGIEEAIYAVKEQENLRRRESGEERWEQLEMEDQARLRQELERKR